MRISNCSSDVCSSDRPHEEAANQEAAEQAAQQHQGKRQVHLVLEGPEVDGHVLQVRRREGDEDDQEDEGDDQVEVMHGRRDRSGCRKARPARSEEHTSELQSLMRISYAVFCLNKNTKSTLRHTTVNNYEQY